VSAGNDFTHVEFAALEQGQSDFQRTYTSLQTVLDDLEQQLQTNLAEWTGAAQGAYTETRMVWNAAMANLQATLTQLASSIGIANDSYQEAERSVRSRWG
jgi:WXG100 family type VII secretion target